MFTIVEPMGGSVYTPGAAILAGGGAAAAPLPTLYDTFTDANGTALTSHTMNNGSGWIAATGTFTIQSNKAQSGGVAISRANAGTATGTVSVTLTSTSPTTAGVIVRASGTGYQNCYLCAANGTIVKFQAASGSALNSGGAVASGTYLVEVVLSGNTIAVYRDGVQVGTATNAFNNTATEYGLYSETSGDTFDNFQFN